MPVQYYGDRVVAKMKRHLAIRLSLAARTVRDYARMKLGEKRAGRAVERQIKRLSHRVSLAEGSLARAAGGEALSRVGARRVERLPGLLAARDAMARTTGVSLPGEFPSMRTGHLRRNVQMEVDAENLVARVGTNVKYGRWLEFGTRKMAARPWLSRTLRETAGDVRQILEVEVERGAAE